jgi:hypothetical protein
MVNVLITTKDSKNEEIDIGTMVFINSGLVRESVHVPGENQRYNALKALDEKYKHLQLRKSFSGSDCNIKSTENRYNMPILLVDKKFSNELTWVYVPYVKEPKLFVIGHPDISVLEPLDVRDIFLWSKPDF